MLKSCGEKKKKPICFSLYVKGRALRQSRAALTTDALNKRLVAAAACYCGKIWKYGKYVCPESVCSCSGSEMCSCFTQTDSWGCETSIFSIILAEMVQRVNSRVVHPKLKVWKLRQKSKFRTVTYSKNISGFFFFQRKIAEQYLNSRKRSKGPRMSAACNEGHISGAAPTVSRPCWFNFIGLIFYVHSGNWKNAHCFMDYVVYKKGEKIKCCKSWK